MSYSKWDLGSISRNVFQGLGRIIQEAFDPDNGGGLICDVKAFGSEGTDSFFFWDYSEDKCFIQRTTADTSPGRLLYIQHLTSAVAAGQTAQGMQLRCRATGTGAIAGGVDGVEIKAGLNSDADTGTLAQARAVISNVDAKKGTITVARMFECTADVGAGGTITQLMGYRASLNNSGTVTTSYAYKVDTPSVWDYGFYTYDGMVTTGVYIGTGATTGVEIASAATGVTVTASSTTILTGNLSVAVATGNYAGIDITVVNTDDRTGGIVKGASINVNPLNSKDINQVYGLESCVYMAAAVETSGTSCAIFSEIQGGGTIGGDLYSLYAYYAPSCTPSGSQGVVRLESNVSEDARCETFIHHVGGKALFTWAFGPLATQTAWAYTGTAATQSGWLKVKVATNTRYIALYTSVS